MEKQVAKLAEEIEGLTIQSLGIGQFAKSRGDNETFGRMQAVSRFLRAALQRLEEPQVKPDIVQP